MFVTNAESPTIARFDEVDGELVHGERVSFANFGLSSLFFPPTIVSDTKAYYLDPSSLQIIVWNPSAMETIGALPLAAADRQKGYGRQCFNGRASSTDSSWCTGITSTS